MAVVVVVALAAGVGVGVVVRSHKSRESTATLIAHSDAATLRAGTAHFNETTTLTSPIPLTLTTSGDVNFKTGDFEKNLSDLGNTETARSVAGVGYFEPGPIIPLPGGAHWVKVLPSDLGAGSGSSIAGTSNSSPGANLQYLDSAVGTATVAGHQTIDGVATTAYTLNLNLQSQFQQAGNALNNLSPALGQSSDSFANDPHLASVPAEVWLDSSGRVRQLTFKLTLQAAGVTVSETDTSTFGDFGEPVHVSAPAARDTVSFSAFKNALNNATPGPTA
ncbi:MAG: hypothetical protein ACRDZ8_03000 [Acidimicrobiales bacterium]